MGVNNRQRRAAKKKKAAKGTARPTTTWQRFVPEVTPELARAELFDVLATVGADPATAATWAHHLLRPDAVVPPDLMRRELFALLHELTSSVVRHGWCPSDLAYVVRQRLSDGHVAALLGLLDGEAARHPSSRVSPAWLDDLAGCGLAVALDPRIVASVRVALGLASVLAALPPIAELLPPPGRAAGDKRSTAGGDSKMLAKVRALLAKAESTEYDEEADALSAKAQELISRHSLERLLTTTGEGASDDGQPSARRLWIDPPYVFAKSMLVAAVADANRCRSVLSEGLGCCTIVGDQGDLASVDVLATSLLVQASVAMRRHGRQLDRSGTSRTRSFRQAFLVAYAGRIRERLADAAEEAVQSTGRVGELVPVLHRRAEQVTAATEAMFPHLVTRETAIRNAQGWVAGRAAADFARLETGAQITEAAS